MVQNCGCNCSCEIDCQENNVNQLDCPYCGVKGKKVSLDVVFTFADKGNRSKLRNTDYYLCLNSDCHVAYYNDYREFITVDNLRQPIWFKKGAEPKIICYCNNITEEQIKEAVKEHDLKSWDGIVSHYRDKKVCACSKLNPTGECCSETFYKVINETLKGLGKEQVKVSGQCCS